MTLSNFDWTDKTSVKWFIMLPTGHEGPYDLLSIKQRCLQGALSRDVKIWSEGLDGPVTARMAIAKSEETVVEEISLPPIPVIESEEVPPLPEDSIPPLPLASMPEDSQLPVSAKSRRSSYFPIAIALMVTGLVLFMALQWIKGKEKFSIRRHSKMSPELQERIQKEFAFTGWDQKIFFKEYVPADMSMIWLVSSSFHECDVEASFHSIKGKLLAVKDEQVAFRTKGVLNSHVAELSSFDFSSGNKVIPGMYELDVKASNCKWDSLPAKLSNVFSHVEGEYFARTNVILYPKGPAEFNAVLSNLLKKKSEEELQKQNKKELYWQDLQQKFQTLLALSLQIEQHMLDFLDNGPKHFKQNLNPAVNHYTNKFGHFLTNFVVANESYFNQLDDADNRSKIRNYELLIKSTAKKVGLESMKIIEELQKMKSPNKTQLNTFSVRLKKTFAELKNDINQKIIQISEDRSM